MIENEKLFKEFIVRRGNAARTADDYASNLRVLSKTLGMPMDSTTVRDYQNIDIIIQNFSQTKLSSHKLPASKYQERCKSALRAYLDFIEKSPPSFISPDEIENSSEYPEGSKKRITVNAYERNDKARQDCINIYGLNCWVCHMNFEQIYGEIGKGYIHVHHKKPLSTIDEEYVVNPETDLIPLCPNCHAMVHQPSDYLTLDKLKKIYDQRNNP